MEAQPPSRGYNRGGGSNRTAITDMRRPDPATGIEGDAGYAEHYVRFHEQTRVDPALRIEYAEIVMIDAFLDDGYSLLDVGCGTAGFHRLLRRHGHVVGIDFSQEMITAAKDLAQRYGLRDCEYVASTFEAYRPDRQFDAISFAGIYGWYRSWRGGQGVLDRLAGMLAPGGLVVLSYVPPSGIVQWLKSLLLAGRTTLIPEREFRAMLAKAGLAPVLTLAKPHTRICFARKA